MSFPRAPRFADSVDEIPPVGSYHPLLKAHTRTPKFSTTDRFKPEPGDQASSSTATIEKCRMPETKSRLQRDKLQNQLCEMTRHLEERDTLISKLRTSRKDLIARIEYLEKTLQGVSRKVSAKKESVSGKKIQCHEASSGVHESLATCEAVEAMAEGRLSKTTSELKHEIEKLINDSRNDDASGSTTESDSDALTCQRDVEHASEELCFENKKLVSTVSELQCKVKALKNSHEDLESKHEPLAEQTVNHETEKLKLQQQFEEIMTESKALMANVKCLQAETSGLESAYSSIELRYEEIESQLDQVRCENACLRSLLHDRDNEIFVLEQHKQDMLEQLIEAEQELSSRQSGLENLHSRNKELSSIEMKLEQELKTTKDTLCALEDEKRMTERGIAKLLEEKNVLQKSNQSYLAKCAELEKELSKNIHELETCHSEANLMSDKNCNLAKELSAATRLHEVAAFKNGELEKSLDGLSKEKAIIEQHLASVTAKLKSAEASLNQVNDEHVKMARALSASEKEAGNLKNENANLLSKVATTEKQLKMEQAISHSCHIEIGELQERVAHFEQEALMSENATGELLDEKTLVESALLGVIEEKGQLEGELYATRDMNEELNATKVVLQMQLSAVIQELQAQVALIREAKLEAAKDSADKDKAFAVLEDENKNLANALLEQQQLSSKLETELVSMQASVDSLRTLHSELQSSSELCKQQLSVAERRANKYKLLCSELDNRKRDLYDRIKLLSEELTELKNGQVANLAEMLKDVTEEARKWKSDFEVLQLRVKPFQDQLELYEMEKQLLERQNEATESELSKLYEKVSTMMGHQNHKQKIHYLSKVSEERNKYKKEVYTLREKVLKQMKEMRKLEVLLQQRRRKSVLKLSAKENLEPPH